MLTRFLLLAALRAPGHRAAQLIAGCAGHGLGGGWTPSARWHGPFVPPTPRSLSACVERQGWQPKYVGTANRSPAGAASLRLLTPAWRSRC